MGVSKISINGIPIIDLTDTELISAQAPLDSYFYQANGVKTQGSAKEDSQININDIEIKSNGIYYPEDAGCEAFSAVTVNVDLQSQLDSVAVPCEINSIDYPALGEETIEVFPNEGKFFNKVTVRPVGGDFIKIQENDITNMLKITENSVEPIDVREYSLAEVKVVPNLQKEKPVTIKLNAGESNTYTINADKDANNYVGLESVKVTCEFSDVKTEYYTSNLEVVPSEEKQIFMPETTDGKLGYYSSVTVQPIYHRELVVSEPGEYSLENGYFSKVTVNLEAYTEPVSSAGAMNDKLADIENAGKIFRFVGNNEGGYTTNGLYMVTSE